MTKFADSPYFLLRDYMWLLNNIPTDPEVRRQIVNASEYLQFTDYLYNTVTSEGETHFSNNPDSEIPTDFTDYNGVIFDESNGHVLWNGYFNIGSDASYNIVDSYLRGAMTHIVAEGGPYVNLYLGLDDGYIPVRLAPLNQEPIDGREFVFQDAVVQDLLIDETLTVSTVTATGAEFNTYDYDFQSRYFTNNVIPVDTPVYFRKDGGFHVWLKRLANKYYEDTDELSYLIRDYVNTDQDFLYFGRIVHAGYADDEVTPLYKVVFEGIKTYVVDALPVNNRTPKFTELLEVFFDRQYSRIYQQLKDVWSLIDPREVADDYLYYLGSYYGFGDVPLSVDNKREYLDQLVDVLKRKGAYDSIYILYKLLSNDSSNILNIYEKWHLTGDASTLVPHLHRSYYGVPQPNFELTDGVNDYIVDADNNLVTLESEFIRDTYGNIVSFDDLVSVSGTLIKDAFDRPYLKSAIDISATHVNNVITYRLYHSSEYGVVGTFDAYGYLVNVDGEYIDFNTGLVIEDINGNPLSSNDLLVHLGVPVTDVNDFVYITRSEVITPVVYSERGAGVYWYQDYPYDEYPVYDSVTETYKDVGLNDVTLSTRYEVEIDITDEPLDSDAVISQDFATEFRSSADKMRPVNRVVDYSILYSPYTDESSNFIGLYSGEVGSVVDNSGSIFYFNDLPFVDLGTDLEFTVVHNLETNAVNVVVSNISGVVASSNYTISIVDYNTIKITFDETDFNTLDPTIVRVSTLIDLTTGYGGADENLSLSRTGVNSVSNQNSFVYDQKTLDTSWDLPNPLGDRFVVLKAFDRIGLEIDHTTYTVTHDGLEENITLDFGSNVRGSVLASKADYSEGDVSIVASPYTVTHNLNVNLPIVQVVNRATGEILSNGDIDVAPLNDHEFNLTVANGLYDINVLVPDEVDVINYTGGVYKKYFSEKAMLYMFYNLSATDIYPTSVTMGDDEFGAFYAVTFSGSFIGDIAYKSVGNLSLPSSIIPVSNDDPVTPVSLEWRVGFTDVESGITHKTFLKSDVYDFGEESATLKYNKYLKGTVDLVDYEVDGSNEIYYYRFSFNPDTINRNGTTIVKDIIIDEISLVNPDIYRVGWREVFYNTIKTLYLNGDTEFKCLVKIYREL